MKTYGSGLKAIILSDFNPYILMEWSALEQAKRLVGTLTTECQWFHCIDKVVNPDEPNSICYRMSEMLIPEQVVSGVEVSSEDTAWGDALAQEIKDRTGGLMIYPNGPDAPPQINPEFNRYLKTMRVWCHSHVKMKPSPSTTDNTQWKQWIKDARETDGETQPYAMMILNQQNEVFTRVYDPELNIVFENVPVYTQGLDLSYVDEAIKNKIKKKPYQRPAAASLISAPGKTIIPHVPGIKKVKHSAVLAPLDITESHRLDMNHYKNHDLLKEVITPQEAAAYFRDAAVIANVKGKKNREKTTARIVKNIAVNFSYHMMDILNTIMFASLKDAEQAVPVWVKRSDSDITDEEALCKSLEHNIASAGWRLPQTFMEALITAHELSTTTHVKIASNINEDYQADFEYLESLGDDDSDSEFNVEHWLNDITK